MATTLDLTNAGHLKVALLCEGMRFDERLRGSLGVEHQEKIYSYVITDWTSEKLAFPSEIRLDRCYVGFHFNPLSSFEIAPDGDGALAIWFGDRRLMGASLIGRPAFYARRTSDGVPMSAVGCSCANHGVSFFIRDRCFYFNDGEECRFCSLGPTQESFSDTLKFKKLRQVEETMAAIIEEGDRIDFVQLSGGSTANHDREVATYLPYISALRGQLDADPRYAGTRVHLTTMPPHDMSLLEDLRAAGLDTISFDLECPSADQFEKYCPGKTRTYGYAGMRSALRAAVEVFGAGNVFTIVIAGLEPSDTFLPSLRNVMDDGIVPTVNVYHHDPLVGDIDVAHADPEVIVRLAQELAVEFASRDMRAGLLGCAHYDIGHDLRKGYFG